MKKHTGSSKSFKYPSEPMLHMPVNDVFQAATIGIPLLAISVTTFGVQGFEASIIGIILLIIGYLYLEKNFSHSTIYFSGWVFALLLFSAYNVSLIIGMLSNKGVNLTATQSLFLLGAYAYGAILIPFLVVAKLE